jgi:D-alanine-D-alanine ligase
VSDELAREVQNMSLAAHHALGCRGYSRADFMVRDDIPYLLEVNTLPGMTSTSLLPRSAKVTGMDFNQLIAELIRLGLERD